MNEASLFFYLRNSLFRRDYAPHLMEGVHVERKIIQPSFVMGNRAIRVSVKLRKLVHEIPNFFVGRVEDMCTVFMDIDAFLLLTIHIATQVWTFVDNEATSARLFRQMGESSSE